jgi:hypothetical protein
MTAAGQLPAYLCSCLHIVCVYVLLRLYCMCMCTMSVCLLLRESMSVIACVRVSARARGSPLLISPSLARSLPPSFSGGDGGRRLVI